MTKIRKISKYTYFNRYFRRIKMSRKKLFLLIFFIGLVISSTFSLIIHSHTPDFKIDDTNNLNSKIVTASTSIQLESEEFDLQYYMVAGSIGQDDYLEGMVLDQDKNVIIYGCVAGNIGVFRHDPNLGLPLNSTDKVVWGDGAPSSLSLDSSGNIYLAGDHYPEMYLIKYNNNLELQWNKTWGYGFLSYDMIVDSNDNIFVAGDYNDKIIMVKYDPNGNELWNITTQEAFPTFIMDYRILSKDSNDNIYLVYDQYADVHQHGGIYSGPIYRILKFSNTGTILLNFTYIPFNLEYNVMALRMIAMDSLDNLYIFGWKPFKDDTYLIKYNNLGVLQWNQSYNFFQDVYPEELIFDSLGNLYLLGMGDYVALAKIDSSTGNMLWETPHPYTIVNERGYAIALDSKNNVYIAGRTLDTEIPDSDILLIKYNSNGKLLAKMTWDHHGNETGMDIVINSNDEIFIAGRADSFFASNDYDIVFLKIDTILVPGIGIFIIIGLSLGIIAFASIGIFLYIRKKSKRKI